MRAQVTAIFTSSYTGTPAEFSRDEETVRSGCKSRRAGCRGL